MRTILLAVYALALLALVILVTLISDDVAALRSLPGVR